MQNTLVSNSKSRLAVWLLLAAALVVGGCVANQPKPDSEPAADKVAANQAGDKPADGAAGEPGASEPAQDPNGFNITEAGELDPQVQADFERAMALLKEEKYDKGIELLRTVAGRAPNNSIPLINLAIAYQKMGNFERAEESIKKALAINPEHPLANNEYAMIHRKGGRFKEARELYEKVLARYPMFLPARKNLAILCDLYLRDYDCALENYRTYSTAMPEDKNVRIWIADLEKRAGK